MDIDFFPGGKFDGNPDRFSIKNEPSGHQGEDDPIGG
jgi:hypothetical protein